MVVIINIFIITLLVYRSAIYPQGMTFKYGLGGRLQYRLLMLLPPLLLKLLSHIQFLEHDRVRFWKSHAVVLHRMTLS